MRVTISPHNAGVIVAFSEYGYRVAVNRFGHYEPVLRWSELQALAAGVEKSATPEQAHGRVVAGLSFFAKRRGVEWPA